METFRNIFNNFVSKNVDKQIEIIDELCNKYDIDASLWWKDYLKKDCGDFNGIDILTEMLDKFIYYLGRNIERQVLNYFEPKGYNIFKEPYLSIDIAYIDYNVNKNKFYYSPEYKENVEEALQKLKLDQKIELLKNKLFSDMVIQTKIEFLSKKDIRALKLRKLNEIT